MAMAGCWPLFICFASGQSKRQPITEFSTEFCVLRRSSRMSIADEFFCQITEFYRVLPSFFFFADVVTRPTTCLPLFCFFIWCVRFFFLNYITSTCFVSIQLETNQVKLGKTR